VWIQGIGIKDDCPRLANCSLFVLSIPVGFGWILDLTVSFGTTMITRLTRLSRDAVMDQLAGLGSRVAERIALRIAAKACRLSQDRCSCRFFHD
jgi:hypothetical protein